MKTILFAIVFGVVCVVLAKMGFTPEPVIDAVAAFLSAKFGIMIVVVPALGVLVLAVSCFRTATR